MQEKAFAYVDAQFEEALSLWKALVEKESPFWNKPAVDDAIAFFFARCKAEGLYVRRIHCATTGDGIVVSNVPEALYKHGIAFMAHLDTVHEIGSFGTPAVITREGWLHGPGVGDCKGGAVMALYTMLALHRSGYVTRPLKLLIVGNEEGGRPDAENYIPAELAGSDMLFNCETGMDGAIVTSRKASVGAIFSVRGKAAHVGHLSTTPASAIREAAHKILALEQLSDYQAHVFSCGEIQGGTIFTSVPDTCTFKVNCRIRAAEDADWLRGQLAQIASKTYVPGTTTTVSFTGNFLPMAASAANDELFARFCAASERLGYGTLQPLHSGGGSDASYAVQLGIPTICATGVIAQGAHTLEERAQIESLRQRARIHIHTILHDKPGRELY